LSEISKLLKDNSSLRAAIVVGHTDTEGLLDDVELAARERRNDFLARIERDFAASA
jgi:hypothetical protein